MKYWKHHSESDLIFDPRFRKATKMMKVLSAGFEELFPEEDMKNKLIDAEIYLGSLHGEIEPTFNYLKGLAESEVGRPFLFQNSLHHSTTGFLTQQYQLLGPAYSLCGIENAQVELLMFSLSQSLLNKKNQLLIYCDSFPIDLAELTEFESETKCEILYLAEDTLQNYQWIKQEDSSCVEVDSFEKFYQVINSRQSFTLTQNQAQMSFVAKNESC